MKPMETQKKIESDFKIAFKSGDKVSKRTLRMVLASIKLVEVDKREPLSEGEVFAVLQKEIKSLRELISDAEKAGRGDLIAEAESEIQILKNIHRNLSLMMKSMPWQWKPSQRLEHPLHKIWGRS